MTMQAQSQTNKKALIYCRVSSVRQSVEGHGLESQEHRCREYANQRGYEVERVFRDSFTGGGDFMKRPAMSDMLSYIDVKSYNQYTVIFDDLKRFARDVQFHLKLRASLKARNVIPECLNFNFEDTPEGEYAETILAAGAELERKQNRRQVIQKQKARLERGYWPFYPPPGYKQNKDLIHGKLLTPVEAKANIIQEALEGFASGRFQEQVDVQRFLQENDFCDGKPVYLEKVKRLLVRIVYAGYIEYPDWEVSRRKGYHQALISLITHEKIMDKLDGRVNVRTRKDVNADFPLRGFVLCATCCKPQTASWSKGRNGRFPYYRCKTGGCAERNKSVSRDVMEKGFKAILGKVNPSEQSLNLTKALFVKRWEKKVLDTGQANEIINKELVMVQQELANLAKVAGRTTNETVLRTYEAQIEKLGNKELVLMEKLGDRPTLRADFETALNEVFKILKNPLKYWENGDIQDQRLVLKLVFQEPLAYNRKSGFETAILSLPLRVFELSTSPNSQLVEMAGIEPA